MYFLLFSIGASYKIQLLIHKGKTIVTFCCSVCHLIGQALVFTFITSVFMSFVVIVRIKIPWIETLCSEHNTKYNEDPGGAGELFNYRVLSVQKRQFVNTTN